LIATIEAKAPDAASAEAHKAFTTAEINDLRRRHGELNQRLASIETALRQHRETLAASGHLEETVEALNNRIRERNTAVEEARRSKGEVEAELAAALVAEAGARQRLAGAQGELSRVMSAIHAARRDMEALQALWTKAGLAAEPEVGSFEQRPNSRRFSTSRPRSPQ
jgi:chromosome segregation ATPase